MRLPSLALVVASVFFAAATPASANLFFNSSTELVSPERLGSNVGAFMATRRCAPLSATPAQQMVPVGIQVHSRNDFFFGTQISGFELLCQRLDDGLVMTEQVLGPLAGRIGDGGLPGTPYMRICPTGQVLTGLRGRSGLNVDAVSILCAEVNPNQQTGVVSKGQTFAIGNPIWGAGGTDDSATCSGVLFLRGIDISFDGVARQFTVRCGTLAVQPLGTANQTSVRLHPTTRNQRVEFSTLTADAFSLSIVNRGRTIEAGEAFVRLSFIRDVVAVTAPAGCLLQTLPIFSVFTCSLPQVPRGVRQLVPGFHIQPTAVLNRMTEVGTVDVVDATGAIVASASSVVALFPGILWP